MYSPILCNPFMHVGGAGSAQATLNPMGETGRLMGSSREGFFIPLPRHKPQQLQQLYLELHELNGWCKSKRIPVGRSGPGRGTGCGVCNADYPLPLLRPIPTTSPAPPCPVTPSPFPALPCSTCTAQLGPYLLWHTSLLLPVHTLLRIVPKVK